MSSKDTTVEKVAASEIEVGDTISSKKGGEYWTVEGITAGSKAVRLVGRGGASIRPRHTTPVWRQLQQAAEESRKGNGKSAAPPVPRTAKELAAERKAAEEEIKSRGRTSTGTGTRKRKSAHPQRDVDGCAAARALTGQPDEGGPKVPINPRQIGVCRKAKTHRPDDVSKAQLKKMAAGDVISDDTAKAVRAWARAHKPMAEDKTLYGRKLAAIALVLRDEDGA